VLSEAAASPIFIVGMPRSGTTLVEQILATHPEVAAGGELLELGQAVESFAQARGQRFPEVAESESATLGAIAEDYLKRVAARRGAKARLTDKLPTNFYFIALIHRLLPRAKIIHCRRDPLDTCLSCFKHAFKYGQEMTYDLETLGRFYAKYAALMRHWRNVLPADAFLDVDYETLTADPAGEVRRIIDHCGLAWDDACLRPHATARIVTTASQVQVRRPIYRDSVASWRLYEKHLAPLVAALGESVKK
jgi:LPS sulfotransferase NodH